MFRVSNNEPVFTCTDSSLIIRYTYIITSISINNVRTRVPMLCVTDKQQTDENQSNIEPSHKPAAATSTLGYVHVTRSSHHWLVALIMNKVVKSQSLIDIVYWNNHRSKQIKNILFSNSENNARSRSSFKCLFAVVN